MEKTKRIEKISIGDDVYIVSNGCTFIGFGYLSS